jgi:hypothetical protein
VTHAVALKQGEGVDDVYDTDAEQARLRVLLEDAYAGVLRAVNAVVAQAFSGMVTLRLDDPAVRRILQEAASRVVGIDETTRSAIRVMLAQGHEAGYSAWQIAHGVPEDNFPGIDGLFKDSWASRGETIARTELQHAQVRSAVDRYHATGLVDKVEIVDGEDDEPCKSRNGKIVPLEQVPGLGHPRCTLAIIPIIREDV